MSLYNNYEAPDILHQIRSWTHLVWKAKATISTPGVLGAVDTHSLGHPQRGHGQAIMVSSPPSNTPDIYLQIRDATDSGTPSGDSDAEIVLKPGEHVVIPSGNVKVFAWMPGSSIGSAQVIFNVFI